MQTISKERWVLLTGERHARVTIGSRTRYAAVLDPAPVAPSGVRLSRRLFGKAGVAKAYGNAVRRRLAELQGRDPFYYEALFSPAAAELEMEVV